MGWSCGNSIWLRGRQHLAGAVLCFFILCPQTLWAAGLIEVLQQAQKNDPTLQAAYYKNLGTREQRTQAIAQLLPSLMGSAEAGQTYQNIRSSDNTVYSTGTTDYGTTSYSLTLTQPLLHWESIVGLQQADAKIFRSEMEYKMAVQDLIIRVADLYLKVLAAQDQLAFAKTEQSAIEKLFELASGQFKKGLIPITDLHDAKARRATILAKNIEAENQLDDALQALQEMTGQPAASLQTLKPDVALIPPDPIDAEAWITAAQQHNPSILMQKYAVEVASKEVDRQKSGHYPTVDLIGRYNNQDNQGSLFGGGSNVDTSEVLVKLNVPFYQGGQVNSRVNEADHLLSATRQELIRQSRAVDRQTRAAFLGVKSAINRVKALQQSVASNQLALDAKQTGFVSGLYTSLGVLDAERDLYLTKQWYAQARYDYLLNSLKLKKAADSLTESDLQQLAALFR